jgi:hypothetical protein
MVGALTSFGTGSGDAENQEVRLVGGEERLDARLPVSCGNERIQQSLATQREPLQACEKLPHGTIVGKACTTSRAVQHCLAT